jgi:O-antigen biosynthesis protein WbqP
MSVYRSFGKRLFDVCSSASALIVLSPLMLLTALLIRVEDGGPALFRQKRVGKDGREFLLFKFRSMPVNTANVASAEAAALTVTRVGRVIRRANIDELPQLFNMLKGNMSVVGPRPALASQTRLLELRAAEGAMSVRPGLTGLAQVNSYDGMSEIEKARYDGQYAKSLGFFRDVGIILRTFVYLTRRPPVY